MEDQTANLKAKLESILQDLKAKKKRIKAQIAEQLAAVNADIKSCKWQITVCQDETNWKRLSDTKALLADLKKCGLYFPGFGEITREYRQHSEDLAVIILELKFDKEFRERLVPYCLVTLREKHRQALDDIKEKFGFTSHHHGESIWDYEFDFKDSDGTYYCGVAEFNECPSPPSIYIRITVKHIGANDKKVEFVKDPNALEEAMLKVLLQTIKEQIRV
jgi:hypothetical protein